VNAYVKDYADDLTRVWAVERPFALHLNDGVVSGRADVILDEEGGRTGSLAIVDYKVASDDAREERYKEQLRIYTSAGRGEGLEVEAAYLHELRDGTRSSIDISEAVSAEAVADVSSRLGSLRKGHFEPKPDVDRCGPCEYRYVCAHAPVGALGHEQD
jgi:DNA helicase-2/ATP-dependent DNA helicase PcrA